MHLLRDQSLKNLNTFGVDVKAELFAEVFSEEELIQLLSDEKSKSKRKFVLGGGSNILFTKDFDGIVIKISKSDINIIDDNKEFVILEVGAGVIWDNLVTFCVERNFGGIENLRLIPGTVGAAPVQNIGAYGQELTETFVSLDGFYIDNSYRKTFTKEECSFSYRSSIFKKELKNKFIITSICLKLLKNPVLRTNYKSLNDYLVKKEIDNPTIKDISNAVAEIRRGKLPDPTKIGNAGSFFKNPEVSKITFLNLKSEFDDIINFPAESGQIKIAAGWLIENCGWKGKRLGDVGTSPDHALVICNFGKASGSEILEFAMRIKEEVSNKFGISLQEEVNIL